MKKIAAISLFPILVNAEPGPVTQYLMNEPATLFDIGMMRLETLTTEFEKRVGLHWMDNGEYKFFRAEIYSQYKPNDDKIYVSFLITNSEPTEAQMAEGCENALAQMNIWLLKSLPGLFLNTENDNQSRPPNFNTVLTKMFELHCHFSSGQDTSEGQFWASRTLACIIHEPVA